jgi:hypothetical protein
MATKSLIVNASSRSTVVEHSSCQLKIKASSPALGIGREEMTTKSLIVNASSIVVELSSHLLKFKASSPAIGTKRVEMATKSLIVNASSSSTVVEHSSHLLRIKASRPDIGIGREEMATKFNSQCQQQQWLNTSLIYRRSKVQILALTMGERKWRQKFNS